MSVIVQGLDISITATGIAWPNGATLTVKPAGVGDRRLNDIVEAVVLGPHAAVNLVVIEDLPINAMAAGITGMVHGAIRYRLMYDRQSYALVPPATLKKYATGRGNASKADMAVALYKRTGLELGDDNQVDAWWLRAIGHQLLSDPCVELPAAQIGALTDKVRRVGPTVVGGS